MVLDWHSCFFTRWVPGLTVTISNKITDHSCKLFFWSYRLTWIKTPFLHPEKSFSLPSLISSITIRCWLFKRWMVVSTGLITIQRIIIRKANCTIHWLEIYLVDGGIHLLINWGQSFVLSSLRIPKALHGRDVDIFQDQKIPTPKRIFIWMKGVITSFVNLRYRSLLF